MITTGPFARASRSDHVPSRLPSGSSKSASVSDISGAFGAYL